MKQCSVDGCEHRAQSRGMCGMHYMRWHKYGRLHRVNAMFRSIASNGYVRIYTPEGRRYEHIVLAEKALGKPLPPGAVVHHMNQDRADNHTPYNLVVCPDKGYHKLLHMRMKALGYENNQHK